MTLTPKNRRVKFQVWSRWDFQSYSSELFTQHFGWSTSHSSWIKNLDFGQWNLMNHHFCCLNLILLWLNPTNIFPKKSGWSLMKPSFFFSAVEIIIFDGCSAIPIFRCWNQCYPNSFLDFLWWNLEASINGNTPSFAGLVGGFKDFFFMTFHFIYGIYNPSHWLSQKIIFQRGWKKPPTSILYYSLDQVLITINHY